MSLKARDPHSFSHTHGSRLSIDPDHHVTEAIGDMYTDSSDRYSYISSPTSPHDVAQEISNLQALRRMSMDVTSISDPDLPSFSNFVPSTPPEDGGDPGSLLWVPARLHPELAPQEFSKYIEAKKNEIRRGPSQRESGGLSPDSGPGLRRKKSMLSRQIDDSEAAKKYQDGAERLGKRSSVVGLEDLMNDPSTLIEKLSVDAHRREEDAQKDDMPIIQAPKVGLRRSTATHYRKGSLRRGERVGSMKRLAAARASETDPEDNANSPIDFPKGGFKLERVATEPISLPSHQQQSTPELRSSRRRQIASATVDSTSASSGSTSELQSIQEKHKSAPAPKGRRSSSPKSAARSRTSEPTPPVPKIVETPPPPPTPILEIPERQSSFEPPKPASLAPSLKKRPPLNRADTSEQVSTLRTPDPSTPTSKKPTSSTQPTSKEKEAKEKDSKEKERKTWNWLPGYSTSDKEEKLRLKREARERERSEKEKEKEREKEKEKEKRPKSADNTRLDVLQKSIEMGNTGRVVGAVQPLPSAKQHEQQNQSQGKDKDNGIFSFFSGTRKKSNDKKREPQPPTPPQHQEQERPQTPFYYTRFPIHIERAIYRLSHLKLANPRRPLQQQVLLSNFMYSYLAKVQQTQPGLVQQATNAKRQEEARLKAERKEQERREAERREERREEDYYYDEGQGEEYDEYTDDDEEGSADHHHHHQQQENGYQERERERDPSNHDGGGGKGDMW